jgi:hypothetical protein
VVQGEKARYMEKVRRRATESTSRNKAVRLRKSAEALPAALVDTSDVLVLLSFARRYVR